MTNNSDNNRDFGNGLICGMVSACIIWILVVEYILIPSRVQLENQAIEHGYGKIIIRDGKRTFSWIDKLEDNQTERK